MRVFSEYMNTLECMRVKELKKGLKGMDGHFGIKRRIFHHGYHVGNDQAVA